MNLGRLLGGFWGVGVLGGGNLKSKGSEAENGLRLATWGVVGNEAEKSKSRGRGLLKLEARLRHQLRKACLILPALGNSPGPCHALLCGRMVGLCGWLWAPWPWRLGHAHLDKQSSPLPCCVPGLVLGLWTYESG